MINQKRADTDLLTLVAPSGGVSAGVPVLIGSLVVFPVADAAQGEPFAGATRGEYTLPKATGTEMTAGALVEYDPSEDEVVADGTASCFDVGIVTATAASSATEVRVAALGVHPVTANDA